MTGNLEQLKEALPDYAKDIRLNLSAVLKEDPQSGLSMAQVHGIALASACATRHPGVISAMTGETTGTLSVEEINAARAAAVVMAMNNVYYRFIHLAHDAELSALPAGLRMNVIGNPGIDKGTFELYSLAVSAINGCGMCMNAHDAVLKKHGVARDAVQSAVRIGAVIGAVAGVLAYEAAA